ncbi:MAG: hypothetical protein IT225_08770 [Flavobacteriales bacterium]|jgi:hypothetical protein|nr:hypothetical protein [Flavobacteriales bacterium]
MLSALIANEPRHTMRMIIPFLLVASCTDGLAQSITAVRIQCPATTEVHPKRVVIAAYDIDPEAEVAFTEAAVTLRSKLHIGTADLEGFISRSGLVGCRSSALEIPVAHVRSANTDGFVDDQGTSTINPTGFPLLRDTGEPQQDAAVYQLEKAQWIEQHPEEYQRMLQRMSLPNPK